MATQIRFDMICEVNGTEYRLSQPSILGRINRTIKESRVKCLHFYIHDQLRSYLNDF